VPLIIAIGRIFSLLRNHTLHIGVLVDYISSLLTKPQSPKDWGFFNVNLIYKILKKS